MDFVSSQIAKLSDSTPRGTAEVLQGIIHIFFPNYFSLIKLSLKHIKYILIINTSVLIQYFHIYPIFYVSTFLFKIKNDITFV